MSVATTRASTGASPKGTPGARPITPAPNLEAIPAELRALPQWVCWRYTLKDGRWTKVPRRATRGNANTTDPESCTTFDAAVAAYRRRCQRTDDDHRLDGIGFVFTRNDPFVGIDLDYCLDEQGGSVEWAKPFLDRLDTYGEVSPSGRGIKYIARGKLPGAGHKRTGFGPDGTGAVEMYDQARYFTITGRHVAELPEVVVDLAETVAELYAELWPPEPEPAPRPVPAPAAAALPADDDLLDRARRAKNGAEFSALFDRGDTSGHNGDDSSADLALCNLLAFWFGGDPVAIDRVFRRSALCREKWEREDYRNRTIARAIAGTGNVYEPSGPASSRNGNGRGKASATVATQAPHPVIEVNHERHRMLAESLAVLPHDPDLYCRGDVLVRVVREQEDTTKLAGGVTLHNTAGMARVVPLEESGLGCRITALADFVIWHKDKNGEYISVPTTPPAIIVRAILCHARYPGVRPLRGIASAPFPRPDGSLVITPGYDAATGVYLAPGVALAPIPSHPTQAAAEASAGRLLAVVDQFPFASEDDRVVWLAALVGAIARPGISGPVPGTAVVSNVAGTGKGTLIDGIGIIGTGHPIPTTSYPYDDDEARKVKVSLAITTTEIVHLDNIDSGRQYGNGALDSALTSQTVNDRILGQSKQTGPIELRPSWFLSGNNITPGKDADRRWLVCNLETELERPYERNDLKIANLLGYIAEHRAELLHDALVILQAHAAAGRPTDGWAPLGSFAEWDRVVRGAVWFATGRDCNATRREAADEAPERLNHLGLLQAWGTMPGCGATGRGMTPLEACRLAAEMDGSTQGHAHPELADALLAFSKDGKAPSHATVGFAIRGIAGRNIGGKLFQRNGRYRGYALWRVKDVAPRFEGDGEDGEDDSQSSRIGRNIDHDVMAQSRDRQRVTDGEKSSSPSSPSPSKAPSCGGCLRLDCRECNP